MTLQAALAQLAGLSVSGVAHNYAVDMLPDTLSRVQLPALLVLPGRVEPGGVAPVVGDGFQANAFSGGAQTLTCGVTHLLLAAPVSSRLGRRTHLPEVVALIDNYCAALAADSTLNATLSEPAAVRIEAGVFTYGGVVYHGCAFDHTWLLTI